MRSDHTTKWYMHKPEPVQENETPEIFWNFEIRTDHRIPTRIPDLLVINKKKKNLVNCGLYRPGGPQTENQRKRKQRQPLRPCQRTKKAMERKGEGDTTCNWWTWHILKKAWKEAGKVGNLRTNWDHPDYNIIIIGLNREKSPGDLWRLAVTRTLVKDHQLTLM